MRFKLSGVAICGTNIGFICLVGSNRIKTTTYSWVLSLDNGRVFLDSSPSVNKQLKW